MTDTSLMTEAMADQLTAAGCLSDQSWRPVLSAVPRHLFAPARARAVPGSADAPPEHLIDRDADPARWMKAVYAADMAVVTQRDDGSSDPAAAGGTATCSLSAPCVVLPFLELLGPRPGQRVLEIGTGTGWTAGLLSARIGAGQVTSAEIDPDLAATARRNLAAVRREPRVLTADGALGVPGETFSRLHVTCGVSEVPAAWIAQLEPGGIAVLPWMPGGWSGWKVRLTAAGDGTATGTFHGPAAYMMLRSQRTSPVLWRPHSADDVSVTTTLLDPRDAATAAARQQVAFAQVPGLVITTRADDGLISVHLAEAGAPDGSWAACDEMPGGKHEVIQHGKRRLWDEFEAVYRAWDASGRPGQEHYRLRVTPDGQAVTTEAAPAVPGRAGA